MRIQPLDLSQYAVRSRRASRPGAASRALDWSPYADPSDPITKVRTASRATVDCRPTRSELASAPTVAPAPAVAPSPAPRPAAARGRDQDHVGDRPPGPALDVEAHWDIAWFVASLLCLLPFLTYSIVAYDGRRDGRVARTYAGPFGAEGQR